MTSLIRTWTLCLLLAARVGAVPVAVAPVAGAHGMVVAGHPEGFPEAFANLYSDAAEAIAARIAGVAADPLALHFPTAEDGLQGLRFVEAVVRSSAAGGAWTDCG